MSETKRDISVIIRLMMPILQSGFYFDTRLGFDVRSILVSELNLSEEFVDERIATVFINGKAVDNIERACLTEGCGLTLSGAMPGLVGACLRKSGAYASLRSAISYVPDQAAVREGRGIVKIKLFNTLINELGARFLERGILVDEQQYNELMNDVSKSEMEKLFEGALIVEKTASGMRRIQLRSS